MTIRTSWTLAAALWAAAGASAATLPCASGTLASYQSLAMGCSVGGTVFADFSALTTTGTLIDPASINLTPLFMGNDRGFRFDLNQTANANDARGILIGYTVGLTGAASVQLNNSIVTPDGANTSILNLCTGNFDPGGPTGCTGASNFAIAFDIGAAQELQAALALPQSAFDVFVDIVIDGGPSGSASLGSVTVLHTIPEPSTWSAALLGLLAAGFWHGKKNQNKENN